MEKEVADAEERVASLRQQLQTLSSVQKSLRYIASSIHLGREGTDRVREGGRELPLCCAVYSDHYATLLHKRDELTRQKSSMLKHQRSAQRKAEDSTKKVCFKCFV